MKNTARSVEADMRFMPKLMTSTKASGASITTHLSGEATMA